MPQQRKNQGKSQQLLLQWSEKNWCYHSLCYKSELRLCFSHWTPESEKRSGLPTILRLQVWSPPPLLVDINRNKAHIGPTHSVHVCVCVCVLERERERERERPVMKGKVIQPPRLVPELEIWASLPSCSILQVN